MPHGIGVFLCNKKKDSFFMKRLEKIILLCYDL